MQLYNINEFLLTTECGILGVERDEFLLTTEGGILGVEHVTTKVLLFVCLCVCVCVCVYYTILMSSS